MPGGSKRAVDWLTGGGIVIALLSPFAAYLPWPLGVWPKVEPTIILLHAGALICAAGLGIACLGGARPASRRDAITALTHPLVLICLAIAAWSIAVAPFSRFPILSIVGSPQIADGAVLWLDIAMFIAGARMIRESGGGLALIGGATAFAAIVLPALAAFPATRAIWFNDYLAFLGLAAAVVVPACLRHRIRSNGTLMALAVLAGAPAIAVSQNYTAILLIVGLSGPAYAAARMAQHAGAARWARSAKTVSAALIEAVALTIPVATAWIGERGVLLSLQSRARIHDVLLEIFAQDPMAWIVGKGWGHTQLYFGEFLASTDATIWNQEWDAAWRDIFHSHNLLFEGAIAAGLPAAAGILCLVMALPLICDRRCLPAAAAYGIGYAGLASLWFQMLGTIAVTALAFAMISAKTKPGAPLGAWRTPTMGVLSIAGIAQAAAIALLIPQAWQAGKIETALADTAARPVCGDYPNEDWPNEDWRGSTGLALQLTRAFHAIKNSPSGAPDATSLRVLDFYACTATQRGRNAPSPILRRAGLLFRSEVAYNAAFAPLKQRFAVYLANWEELARNHLIQSPRRSDLILPFLAWSLAQGKSALVLELTGQVLSNNAKDPVGLWFKGMSILQGNTPQNTPMH